MGKIDYRERAIAEFGEECQVCGSDKDILVHHRDGDRSNNEVENLLPVCAECHGKIHAGREDVGDLTRELGLKPRGGEDTTARVSEGLADELHDRKNRGDSYEDVIWRLIEKADSVDDDE